MPAVWIPKVQKVAQQNIPADDEEHAITRAALLRYRINGSSPPAAQYSLRAMTVPEYQSRALSELLVPPGLFPPPGLTDTVEVDKYNMFKPVAREHLDVMLQCLSANLEHIARDFVLASASALNEPDVGYQTDEYAPKIQKAASESDLSTAASTEETVDDTSSPRSFTKESVTKELSSETSSEPSEDNRQSDSEAGSKEVAKEFIDPLAAWLAKFSARPLWHRPDDGPSWH